MTAVYLENRRKQFGVWREPFVELRVPLLFNLNRDPFEKSYENSNTYNDWMMDHGYALGPMQSTFLISPQRLSCHGVSLSLRPYSAFA